MDNRVSDIMFSVPPTVDLHVFCTLLSYDDRVTVTMTVDSALYSQEQTEELLAMFNEELACVVKNAQCRVC